MKDAKKVHWTQTPAGRRTMAKAARKAHRARRNSSSTTTTPTDAIDEATFSYALGHVEAWLSLYAESAGVPGRALAARVGTVLHRKAGR